MKLFYYRNMNIISERHKEHQGITYNYDIYNDHGDYFYSTRRVQIRRQKVWEVYYGSVKIVLPRCHS